MLCSSCKKIPRLSYSNLCKDCKYAAGKRYRATSEKYKQTHRNNVKKYYALHKEDKRKYYAEWYRKNGRKRKNNYKEVINLWRKDNPEKIKAHKIIGRAIRAKKLIKPSMCLDCKNEKRLSAHHVNYNKPLVVEWLCSSCHKLRHNQLLTIHAVTA